MVKQNLGKLDRTFRFILGIWLLGPLAPIFNVTWVNWIVIIIGLAMNIIIIYRLSLIKTKKNFSVKYTL